MEIVLSGLFLGLMGSFHCVGMCGPIAISLPLRGNSFGQKLIGGGLYNLGRTVIYGGMGACFGMIGQGFQMLGFQSWISIIMGSLMIVSVLFPLIFRKINPGNTELFTGFLRKAIQRLFTSRSYAGLFAIGIINGLLPCGLVYMAIAGAISTGNVATGIIFMLLFGLGTLPMLLAISLLGNLITNSIRNKINRIIPYIVVGIGLIFILRGLNLGIPYLSPPKEKMHPDMHMKTNVSQAETIRRSCCPPLISDSLKYKYGSQE